MRSLYHRNRKAEIDRMLAEAKDHAPADPVKLAIADLCAAHTFDQLQSMIDTLGLPKSLKKTDKETMAAAILDHEKA